jgi:hypothetical protein
MARPVKETPVITGKDAKKFATTIKANEKKRVSKAEFERALLSYKSIKITV